MFPSVSFMFPSVSFKHQHQLPASPFQVMSCDSCSIASQLPHVLTPSFSIYFRSPALTLNPHCLFAFDLCGPSCSTPSASTDPTTLVVSIIVDSRPPRPQLVGSLRLRPRCMLVFGFYGPSWSALVGYGLAACYPSLIGSKRLGPTPQPSSPPAYIALAAPKSFASVDPRISSPIGLSEFGLYSPKCSAASPSADPMAQTAIPIPSSSALANPTALVAFMLVRRRILRPRFLGSHDFGGPHGPYVLAARQPQRRPTPRSFWPTCLLSFGLYCPTDPQPSSSAAPTALMSSAS